MYNFNCMIRNDLTSLRPQVITFINFFIVVIIVLSALVLARDALTFAARKPLTPLKATGSAEKGQAADTLQSYEPIVRNNFFGAPGGPLKPLTASKEGGQAQSEKSLVGTVAPVQGYKGYAIFMDKSGTQEVIKVGDKVPGMGRLEKVDRDKVSVKGDAGTVIVPLVDIVKITDVRTPQSGSGASDFARPVGTGSFIVDQKKILQALENPNQLMTDARLTPNVVNDRQEGFMLREVREGGIYRNLGLQNGDVLLRINDYNISNPETALQAFSALRGMDRVQLDIIRGGNKMNLNYQIR